MSEQQQRKEQVLREQQGGEDSLLHRAMLWIKEKINSSITLDSIRDLPDQAMLLWGLIFNVLLISLLLFFLINGYETNKNTTYLVPATNNDPGICDDVPRPLPNGAYLYDREGNWEGARNFDFAHAAYSIVFNNFVQGQELFTEFMTEINRIIQLEVSSGASSRTLPQNLLYWMSFRQSAPVLSEGIEYNQYLRFTGDPRTIFATDLIYGMIRNDQYDCDVSKIASFDAAGGFLSLVMATSEYNASEACVSILPTSSLIDRFFTDVHGTTPIQLKFAFDIRTFITSVAIAQNVFSACHKSTDTQPFADCLNTLTEQPSILFGHLVYQFFDPRYSGMLNTNCFNTTNTGWRCLFPLQSGISVLPVLNHYGNSTANGYRNCECGVNGLAKDCHTFNFLISLIMYKDDPNSEILVRLMEKYSQSELDLLTYNASHPQFSGNATERKAAFAFCKDQITNRTCTIVTYNVYRRSQTINEYYYFLPEGSCTDTFSTSKLQTSIPPAPMTESYKECRKSDTNAFFDSLGIAIGNATSITPLVVGISVFLYTYYLYGLFGGGRDLNSRPLGKKVTKQEKDEMIQALAVRLCKMKIEGAGSVSVGGDGSKANVNGVLLAILKEIEGSPATINPLLQALAKENDMMQARRLETGRSQTSSNSNSKQAVPSFS